MTVSEDYELTAGTLRSYMETEKGRSLTPDEKRHKRYLEVYLMDLLIVGAPYKSLRLRP